VLDSLPLITLINLTAQFAPLQVKRFFESSLPHQIGKAYKNKQVHYKYTLPAGWSNLSAFNNTK
jgi:hypothetical protein